MTEGIFQFNGAWRWLSNFHPCQIEFEGVTYPSVEHAYQAAKTNDPQIRNFIATIQTASEAKRLGRGLKLRDDWDEVKYTIMHRLLEKKFYDQTLRAALLATKGELVEGNYWHDNIWGRCSCEKCAARRAEPGWLDIDNQLGRQLMEIRESLKVPA